MLLPGSNAYLLAGEMRDGKLTGEWHRADDSERGTWEAARREVRLPANNEVVPLYEWRRLSDDARRYTVEVERWEAGWEKALRPLCRVWRAPAAGRE